MTDFALLRDRLVALRRQTLVMLAEQEDGMPDAGLLALGANVQTALVAVEESIESENEVVKLKAATWVLERGLPAEFDRNLSSSSGRSGSVEMFMKFVMTNEDN